MTEPFLSRSTLRFAAGELVFGYRLVRKLGEGSFGAVWLAANEKGFEWALKFVSLEGNGGQKEFKALQLIKDRRINNTNLLKLIDYGLLDHAGNSVAISAIVMDEPKPREQPVPAEIDDERAYPAYPTASPQGTLTPEPQRSISNQTAVERFAARETQGSPSDTKTNDRGRASWLVIVMEVGQLTLHQIQLQHTQRQTAAQQQPHNRAVTRMGAAANSRTQPDLKFGQVDPVEEPLTPLPVAQVLPYLEQAARGLDYLHRHDIVHRDIKPQNIILVGDDAKVCDYGLASEFTNSAATTIGCTPAYAAPEAINNRPVPASDQYSLAVTYIELITGRWPFFGVTQTAIYREKDEGKHNLSFIRQPAVRAVLKRALSKSPRDRYPTCSEFLQQLTIAEHAPPSLLSPFRFAVAVMLLLVCTAAVLGWVYQDKLSFLSMSNEYPRIEFGEPLNDPLVEKLAEEPIITPPKTSPLPKLGTTASVEPALAKKADETLTAAFANPELSPPELLRALEAHVQRSGQPGHWWSQLKKKSDDANWFEAVENWLQANQNRNPRPASLESEEYLAFDQEFRLASLQRLLNHPLASAAELDSALSSVSLQLNDSHPLGILLRVDLEMRLAGNIASQPQRDDWAGRIESAVLPPLSGQLAGQRSHFVTYLNAMQLAAEPQEFDLRASGVRLQELLSISPPPMWLTPDRKAQLATPLGFVAINELGKTDRDLPNFHQFKLANNSRLTSFLATADFHQLHGPPLAAARALTLASQPAADWQAIGNLANEAFNDSATNKFLAEQKRRLLLYYVTKLAALKTAKPDSPAFAQAVKGFATLLATKQNNSPLYFDFEQGSQPHDSGIFRHLVQPVLSQPAVLADQNAARFDAASLALLWGVQGQLLKRSDAVIEQIETSGSSELSKATQSLVLAHEAFQRARHYDGLARAGTNQPPTQHYITGYTRTLAELPKKADESTQRLKDLIALVNEFDPRGESNDVELLRLGAYVRRQQAYAERDSQQRAAFAREASERYAKVIAATQDNDPHLIHSLACEGLSDLHLNLSQWTELQRTDYRSEADQLAQPAADTKSYHVWRAAQLANQAIAMAGRPQRENAYLALANAQEQMAFTLGLTSNYEQALDSLDQALRAADTAVRPASRIHAAQGRVLLRHAQDLFTNLAADERANKLQAALTALESSLGDRLASKNYELQDAETLFYLAETQIALGMQAPATSADRTSRLSLAEGALRAAIEAGELKSGNKRSPKGGVYRGRLLMVLSNQAGEPNRAAQQLADEIFAAAEQQPADYDPAALFGIATASARLFPEPSKLLRWVPPSGPLHEQWRASDAWKLEAVRLYAEAAALHPQTDLRRSAQQLSLQITANSPQRRLAEAHLQDQLARQLCREFDRLRPPSAALNENQQKAYEADRLGKVGVATTAIRDSLQKHLACQDENIQSLLAEINNTSLASIQAGECLADASVLEKRAIWKFIATAPALDAREKYVDLCTLHISLLPASDQANREQLRKACHDALKPIFLFAELAPREPRLAAMLKSYKPLVLELEKKR